MSAYNKKAVDKAIASSNRHGPRINKKEAKLIHGLLRGWRKVEEEDDGDAVGRMMGQNK